MAKRIIRLPRTICTRCNLRPKRGKNVPWCALCARELRGIFGYNRKYA